VQVVVFVQDTALRELFRAPVGVAEGVIVQCPEAKVLTSVVVCWEVPESLPTATQLVGLVHETPDRTLVVADVGSALAVRVQVVPFQVSMSDCLNESL